MPHPEFFDRVPRLRVRDPLAALLGAADDGVMEYGYADAVRLAGHSCPTVASAYWLTCLALTRLYGDQLPERGGIRADFRRTEEDGVTGVVAAVVGLLTGAAGAGGFQGLGGRYGRRGLIRFGMELPLDFRLVRLDTGARVDCAADLARVGAAPDLPGLLQKCLSGQGDPAERARFGNLWQERVARLLLEHGDDPLVFRVA